jgi:hypothetical protein
MIIISVYIMFKALLKITLYSLTFFFRKTKKYKNKFFWFILLSFSPKNFLNPFVCSYLKMCFLVFSNIYILSWVLVFTYFYFLYLIIKKRNKKKKKNLSRFYLSIKLFKKNFFTYFYFLEVYTFFLNKIKFYNFFFFKKKSIISEKLNFFLKK